MQPSNNSALCIGLDPDPARLPKGFYQSAEDIRQFCFDIIKTTRTYAGAYKLNSAFFEAFGPKGLEAMAAVIHRIRCEQIPVILDAKRADIGNSAKFYARMAYDFYGVDAVTVLPYFGVEALAAFDYPGKTTFVVAASTNADPYKAMVQSSYADLVYKTRQRFPAMGYVAPAIADRTDNRLTLIRQQAPDSWLLIPGLGAQGGDFERTVKAARLANGKTLLNISREILYASAGDDYAQAAGLKAKEYYDRLAAAALPD